MNSRVNGARLNRKRELGNFLYGITFLTGLCISAPAHTENRSYYYSQIAVTGVNQKVSINNNNQIVGSKFDSTGQVVAFKWENGIISELPSLGGDGTVATDINDNGTVVGFSRLPGGAANDEHAFRWTPQDGIVNLGDLGGTSSYAKSINDNEEIVGYSFTANNQFVRGFIWSNHNMQPLPYPLLNLYPESINNTPQGGAIVGHAAFNVGGTTLVRAFLLEGGTSGTPVELGALAGESSYALDINDNMTIVGYSFAQLGSDSHVVRWQPGTGLEDLGKPAGSVGAFAMGVNNDEQIVGNFVQNGIRLAFIYEQGQFKNLNNLVALPSGVELFSAMKINDRGYIAGISKVNGVYGVFMLVPCIGDLNQDGSINFVDLNILLGLFGGQCQAEPGCQGDLDNNGLIDFADLNILLSSLGSCPTT